VTEAFARAGRTPPDASLFTAGVPGWAPRRARQTATAAREWLARADPPAE